MFSRQLLDSAEALLQYKSDSHDSLTDSQVSFHQLCKGLLSRCYDDSARICWVRLSPRYVYKGGTQCMMTESSPQAQQGFAEPPRITMYSTQTQWKIAESDSWLHSSETQQKKLTEPGSPHTQLRYSAKKMAESGSQQRMLPGPRTKCRTGLSLASQRDIQYTEKGKQLTCWATRFLSAWILVSLWVTHQRSCLLWFHLQLSILLCGASSHIEFLLAGRKAVLLTNSCLVTLYQWTTDTAVSCLLGL